MRPRLSLRSFSILSLVAASTIGQTQCGESWIPGLSPHGGPNGAIGIIKTLDIGSGPELFIGPSIT